MAAVRDNNAVVTMSAVLNTGSSEPISLKADASSHALLTDDGSTGSDYGETLGEHDENYVPTLCAVSNDGNSTIVPLYVTASGELLIKST